ncbi:MAG: hypothetical protein REI64_01545 [Pedobacter sp.]|uniref:hypothetical protein n=1 Tax=Pedobacter sp. TaxID=1411316 RepID=UPI002809E40A|nr:hypothetical protein [Pedobacter sp.]MDQ8003450.1 hypothetical protein [Pedobacter sp.]
MRKRHLVFIITSTAFYWCGCNSGTSAEEGHLADSVIADRPQMDSTTNNGDMIIDSPALGTDNIRMDSMNNSNR